MPASVKRARGSKSRLNLKIDSRLKDWAKEYADQRGTDVTKLICEYLIELRRQEEDQSSDFVEQV